MQILLGVIGWKCPQDSGQGDTKVMVNSQLKDRNHPLAKRELMYEFIVIFFLSISMLIDIFILMIQHIYFITSQRNILIVSLF